MARRMYDLDNGTENIKVKSIETINIDSIGHYVSDAGFVFTRNASFENSTFSLPNTTTEARPTGVESMIFYDSTLKKCILYNGTAWVNLDGTALS